MKRKRTPSDESRKLLRFWERSPEFGDPVGCVATTFTFDAPFFEEECLGRFAGIESNPREDQFGYLVEREERLSQVFACVLVDRNHVAKQRSLRWHLLPIRVPGGGIQHAKLSLLVWEKRIRLLVSSANLTEPGYRSNWEQAASLEFTPEGDLPLELLRAGLEFVELVRSLAPQGSQPATSGPHAGLRQFLDRVRTQVSGWTDPKWPRGEPRAAFLPVAPGNPSLFAQVREVVWSGTGASEARVLSPFFDKGEKSREVVDKLVDSMATQGDRQLRFYAPGRRQADGKVEIDLPECLKEPWAPRRSHQFHIVPQVGTDGERRDLHAKGLWLERDGRAVQILGSSNFTTAGVGIDGRTVNVEANIAFILPDSRVAFARMCQDAFPASQAIDPRKEDVTFLADARERTPEGEEGVPLPSGFGLALYVPQGEHGQLLLQIESGAPKDFQVFAADGTPLLSSKSIGSTAATKPIEVPWPHLRPQSHLIVTWYGQDGVERSATWVVNVTDTSRLPAPDELRNLDLEELLEILTSARPLHEMVGIIIRRREKARTAVAEGPIYDPHKRVDTRNFLIRRVRRVSAALEGLRFRLERPASSLDALKWRLHGPVGPVALAQRLAENEEKGAAFMIAEVALTTRQVNWAAAETALGAEAVRTEVAAVVSQLQALAAAHPSPANLATYVEECFSEVGS